MNNLPLIYIAAPDAHTFSTVSNYLAFTLARMEFNNEHPSSVAYLFR